jgi:hypothetical protein
VLGAVELPLRCLFGQATRGLGRAALVGNRHVDVLAASRAGSDVAFGGVVIGAWERSTPPGHLSANPRRVPATVQDSENLDLPYFQSIVDSERKALGQQPAETAKAKRMHPRTDSQRLYVGVESIEEIVPQAFTLIFIEVVAVYQVFSGAW